MTFSELKIIKPLVSALDKLGYAQATPIQQQAIPPILEGKDIFGCAQTGTGKTAAFALPVLQILSAAKPSGSARKIGALILAPTRELALQISASVNSYTGGLPLSHTTVFGGVSQHHQVKDLRRGVDILIATPGRLLDLMQQGFVDLNHIRFFVLDEADRMLDMGFINDIKRVIAKLPARKQTLFFSATASPDIMKLANTLLKEPVKVSVDPVSSASELIKQSVYYVSGENKRALLKYILKDGKIEHALVFTRTKRGADRVAKELNSSGIIAEAIHGNKSQGARERALKGFKNRSIRILVATDIASRGIDVDKLSHVINFEIPEQAETYVHHIGRTGRAGSQGTALSLCTRDELPYLKDINKLIRKNIEVVSSHPFSQVDKSNK
ncbi:MAG: DEAD/DEAH box helicase [Bacteroidetes bacterium]|nr:DEAD/DEAH box helicase [Bacteroidota bacterium]